jgi:carbohydrate kinase (thermoresistant glucokinase family)
VLVVMGVSGCGKSTVGRLLAKHTGWPFLDADDLHPPENIATMAAGTPLTDADREPWLDLVAAWIAERRVAGESGVVACSSLKRTYRDRLRQADPDLRLVYLRSDQDMIATRLAQRRNHFFPPGLLAAQFADLEEPGHDECPIIVPIGQTPEAAVGDVLAVLER